MLIRCRDAKNCGSLQSNTWNLDNCDMFLPGRRGEGGAGPHDNAANCKSAGADLGEEFPWVTWTGCGTHGLDLFLEDVEELEWAKELIKEARELVKFVNNHHKSVAIFRDHSDLELLRPGDTRFATAFMMLERLQEVRQALESMVVDPKWRTWVQAGLPAFRVKADDVKSMVSPN